MISKRVFDGGTVSGQKIRQKNGISRKPRFWTMWLQCMEKCWGIRCLTLGSFFLLLAILGGGFLLISFVFVNRNIRKLTSNSSRLVKTIVENFVDKWLGQGPDILDSLEEFMLMSEGFSLDLEFRNHGPSVEYFQVYLHNFFNIWENVYMIGFGGYRGTLVGYVRWAKNESFWSDETTMDYPCCNYNDTHQPGPLYVRPVYVNNTLGPYYTPRSFPYDFRIIDNGWYPNSLAEINKTYTWTTNLNAVQSLQTSVSKKVYSGSTFLGVLVCAITLTEFDVFMTELLQTNLRSDSGEIFIVDDEGYLLANSWDSPNHKEVGTPGGLNLAHSMERLRPEDSENSLIQLLSREILDVYGQWGLVEETGETYWTIAGRAVSIITPSVRDLSVVFVYSTPTLSIYKDLINVGVVGTVLLGGVGAAFALLCAVAIVLITKPLVHLVDEMQKIERMELDEVSLKRSWLYEVKALQNAFLFTVEKLKEYKSFLPLSLHSLDDDDDIDDVDVDGSEKGDELDDEREEEVIEGIQLVCDDDAVTSRQKKKKSNGSVSDGEDSAGSSIASAGSSNNSSDCSAKESIQSTFGESRKTRLDLNIRRTKRFVAVMKIEGLSEMLANENDPVNREAVVRFSSRIYDLLIANIQKAGGKLDEYHLDFFVFTFRKKYHMIQFIEPFIIDLSGVMNEFPLLKALIGIIPGRVWIGNIGSSKLKRGIVWGDTFTYLSSVLRKYEVKYPVDIIVDDTMANDVLPLTFLTKPIFVREVPEGANNTERPCVIFYRVVKILESFDSAKDVYFRMKCLCSDFLIEMRANNYSDEYYRTNQIENKANLDVFLKFIKKQIKSHLKKYPKDLEISRLGYQMTVLLNKKYKVLFNSEAEAEEQIEEKTE